MAKAYLRLNSGESRVFRFVLYLLCFICVEQYHSAARSREMGSSSDGETVAGQRCFG